MNIPENVEAEYFTVSGHELMIKSPYGEGHKLNEAEASVLNQTYRENIRNNCAEAVKELDKAAAQAYVNEYVEDYEFGIRRGGGGRTGDPVMRAAMDIARDLVITALKKAGVRRTDVSSAELNKRAKAAIEQHDQIRELAQQRVEEAKALEASLLEGLEAGQSEQSEQS